MQPRTSITKDCTCRECSVAREWRVAWAGAGTIAAVLVAGLIILSIIHL